jgi:hypothetical protein
MDRHSRRQQRAYLPPCDPPQSCKRQVRVSRAAQVRVFRWGRSLATGLARFQARGLADPRDRHELAPPDRLRWDLAGGNRPPDAPDIRAQDHRHFGHGGEQLAL